MEKSIFGVLTVWMWFLHTIFGKKFVTLCFEVFGHIDAKIRHFGQF